ncbi:hypothetical protein FRB99_008506 [Tulasnella sp. 403]|nr:hypothetical protein FRB99_008506 [Tulasnella sp. 403]
MPSAQTTLPSPHDIAPSRKSNPQQAQTRRRSRWRSKRAVSLLFFIAFWLIVAYKIFIAGGRGKKPKIVHADRYSNKYKFRPAASPVVTETLRDGTLLVRGAFRNPYVEHDEL